ncbi:YceD family protein [Rhizobium oryzicola]|uniref:DUF177 domain-containing protein n=1 Tax=Rhizobium oryzicola TaxID=1232668 RepID=A0ABT8STL3_9HYPH|nr:DUF177 domain-containing protein [Rhizobium oryzicola]MDO1581777.1 DUF177 domain-containing protein [Rhizobium oryzicola]
MVKVGHVSANAVTVHVEADERERAGLAELWKVVSVESLVSDMQIARWKKDGIRLKGTLKAKIVQACVVTLDPIESEIEESFEQIFVPEGSKLARLSMQGETAEMVLDPDGPDLPETFTGDSVDAGAVVAEFAALSIDPYPRKAGVEFADHIETDDTPEKGKPNPFAVLKDWKSKE